MDEPPFRGARVVIFSRDRPLQLDATLTSLEMHCRDLDLAQVHVLFTPSSPRFAAGYRVLAGQHPNVDLHRESDFRGNLLGVLAGSNYVLFVVDDTLFVGEHSIAASIDLLARDRDLVGFSYRVGRNTAYCYTLDKPQRLPAFESPLPGVLTYDWTTADHDFGYPLELSSSLYRTADLLPLLEALAYNSPNTLEAALSQAATQFTGTRPRLACFEQSVAVSIPANIVQTSWRNRVQGSPDLSTDALVARYERGDRLNVAAYRSLVPNACHQELDFRFTNDPTIPTVSVITRCYNQAEYLPDAVLSVVSQTFTDWEIVVVDDGSPDATAQVAARLAIELGGRLRLVRQTNRGLSSAMNAGVAAARGRYVLPLDADDMIEPTMLEKSVALLERDPTIGFAYTDAVHFTASGEHVVPAAEYRSELLPLVNMPNYCALYRTAIWDAVGGYNPNMRWGYEDWDFWLACAERGVQGRRLAEALFRYRVRADGMFIQALAHDQELRAQLRRNHPSLYGWRPATRRRLRAVVGWLISLPRRLRSAPQTRPTIQPPGMDGPPHL